MATIDFNGDGRDDILWRHSSGSVGNWLGRGDGGWLINDASLVNASLDWLVTGTGDFDGDGRADLLWWNRLNRNVSDWLGTAAGGWRINDGAAYMDSPTALGGIRDFYTFGIGDSNNDGRDDVFWESEDTLARIVTHAEPDGGFAGPLVLSPSGPGAWHWANYIGDFNGDGRSDLLWTDSMSGEFVYNLSLGSSDGRFVGSIEVGPHAPRAWRIIGIADFNGDGRDDILWRNTDGEVGNWLSSGSGFIVNDAAGSHHSVSRSWHIRDVGDYNGDGRSDILWRHDGGLVGNWLGTADGGFFINDANLIQTPLDWNIVSTRTWDS